jgi:hypothetical protein
MQMKKFPGLHNVKGNIMGYFGGFVFIIVGIIIYFLDSKSRNIAFIALGFGLFFFLIVLFMDLPFANYYLISNDYIICVRMFIRKKFYFNEIANISKIKWEEFKEKTSDSWKNMTLATYNKTYARTHSNEFLLTANSARQYNKLIGYCTAAPSTTVYKGKATQSIIKSDYVLLTLANGAQYILSPQDIDRFIESIELK